MSVASAAGVDGCAPRNRKIQEPHPQPPTDANWFSVAYFFQRPRYSLGNLSLKCAEIGGPTPASSVVASSFSDLRISLSCSSGNAH